VLLGGIDPLLVLLSCGATLSTGWFLASLSIWVSTIARRVREAFFIAFGLECLWLFSPLILRNVSIPNWPAFDQATHWLAEWIGASSPIDVAYDLFYGAMLSGGKRTSEIELVAWMMGLQAAFGLVLALLASLQLRPIFRRQDAGGSIWAFHKFIRTRQARRQHAAQVQPNLLPNHDAGPVSSLRARWRLRIRPALGNRPMLWKELYTDRPRGLAQLVGLLLTITGGGFLAYYTYWFAEPAIREVWESGNAPRTNYMAWANRNAFMWFLDGVVPLVYLVGILGVAGAAAASVTSEHEDDTWVSLTATDLTAHEIIFSKILGAMKRGLKFGAVIVFLSSLGALVGSIDSLSIPLLILAMCIYASAAAALGVSISLQLRSTWRAQFLTMTCLLLINVVGQGVLNMLSRFGFAPQLWPGFSPYEMSKLLLEAEFLDHLRAAEWPYSWRIYAMDDGLAWRTIFSIASLSAYTVMAAAFVWHALYRFEIIAGRARRFTAPAPSEPKVTPARAEVPMIG
jgi:hypothetical protein